MTTHLVTAEVAPVWRGPAGSERDDRVTEALVGEPVVVTGAERDGRVEVVAPRGSRRRWARLSICTGWIDAADVGAGADADPPALHVPEGLVPGGCG